MAAQRGRIAHLEQLAPCAGHAHGSYYKQIPRRDEQMQKFHAAVKGSIRTTARAPTALAKRWTVRMDGVPLPLSMRATTL